MQFAVTDEQGPTPSSGALLRVKEGAASEVLVSGLPFPTSIAFNDGGDAFVTTNGVGAPGSGQVLKFTNLTAAQGTPMAGTVGAPAATGVESVGASDTMTDTAVVDNTATMTGTGPRQAPRR